MEAPRRRPTASEVLGGSFGGGASVRPRINVVAPELGSDPSEMSITMETPPLRIGPPGHESFVRLADVEDDPNQKLINCEEEYAQERLANTSLDKDQTEDDITLVDPNETLIDDLLKDFDLQLLINKCLRKSVRFTRTADRSARICGLRWLRNLQQNHISVVAGSNHEADDEDDEDVPDD